jgi:hypothetical protein
MLAGGDMLPLSPSRIQQLCALHSLQPILFQEQFGSVKWPEREAEYTFNFCACGTLFRFPRVSLAWRHGPSTQARRYFHVSLSQHVWSD